MGSPDGSGPDAGRFPGEPDSSRCSVDTDCTVGAAPIKRGSCCIMYEHPYTVAWGKWLKQWSAANCHDASYGPCKGETLPIFMPDPPPCSLIPKCVASQCQTACAVAQ
jgi:hypothetical protein